MRQRKKQERMRDIYGNGQGNDGDADQCYLHRLAHRVLYIVPAVLRGACWWVI